MSKVTLKVEIDEETYKQIKSDSVYDNNNKIIISKSSLAYYALNAIINATSITESDDVVSRQCIESKVEELENICANAPEEVLNLLSDIKNAPPVLPKRDPNKNVKTHYFHTDDYCPKEREEE